MADADEVDEAPKDRRAPQRRADTEQAIGLEVARLFGVSPRLLVKPKSQPPDPKEQPGENG